MNQRTSLLLLMALIFAGTLGAQDYTYRTFKDTRVINLQSPEVLPKQRMDVRISHRFGDLAGANGGWATFYGLEVASDVSIGADYGVTDRLMVGINRTKGAGSSVEGFPGLRQLINGLFKFQLARQTESGGSPVTVTLAGVSSMSGQQRLEGPGSESEIASFPKFSHRFAFHGQVIIARKFSERFSLQFSPGYTHRNLVPFEDQNGMFNLGFATRVQVSRSLAIVADGAFPLIDTRTTDVGYYPALGFGLEMETSGHVFQVNFTNATALTETDFIPYTTSNWLDGEFRLGFTISRWFNL